MAVTKEEQIRYITGQMNEREKADYLKRANNRTLGEAINYLNSEQGQEDVKSDLQNSKIIQGIKKGATWLGNNLSMAWKGLTGQTSAEAQLKANEMNIQNQNYWNNIAMMREDTAHQREVADLQAAGLNPWLSVSGTGTQTAAMSTAQAEPVDGSKMLQATTATALLAIVKLLAK